MSACCRDRTSSSVVARENLALKSTTTTDDHDARLDIKANGLWESKFKKTCFDENCFNPLADFPVSSSEAYKYHEYNKKNKCEQRTTEVEKARFYPLVFACIDEAGQSASKALKQRMIALSAKRGPLR